MRFADGDRIHHMEDTSAELMKLWVHYVVLSGSSLFVLEVLRTGNYGKLKKEVSASKVCKVLYIGQLAQMW